MSEIAIISGVMILLVVLGFLMILPIIGDIVFIQQNWDNYWFWANLIINITRIFYIIAAIMAFLMPLWNGEITLWIDCISYVLLALFGVPIMLSALHMLIFTPLSGLELQRTILNYCIVNFWQLGTYTSFLYHSSKKREEK